MDKLEYNLPIKNRSTELHNLSVSNIIKLLKLQPTRPRNILQEGEHVVRVIVSSDGSAEGCAATVHVVIAQVDGGLRSTLIRSANKCSSLTIPGHELGGAYLGCLLLKQTITHLHLQLLPGELDKVVFFGGIDSRSTGLQILGRPSSKHHLRLAEKVLRELGAASATLDRVSSGDKRIHLCWIPSSTRVIYFTSQQASLTRPILPVIQLVTILLLPMVMILPPLISTRKKIPCI